MAKGAVWMVAMRLIDRLVGFASTIILARLLLPADFGLVALATTAIAVLDIWAEFGFDLALIRNQKAERRHYDTAWTLMALRGLIVGLLILASADWVARFFAEPRVEYVLYALAAMSLIEGCQSIRVVDFRKDLELHREFGFLMTARVVQFAVTVGLAFAWRDYWALVAGILANRSTRLVASYVLAPYRPRPTLSAFGELFGFSKWVVVNSLLNFATNRLDTFVVGRVSGVGALGIYNMAYEVSNMATTELVWPISRALFPGFSKLQDSREELVKSYNMSLALIVLIALPVTVGIGLTSEYIVLLLLGAKWAPAVPVMQVLVIYGGMRVLLANTGGLYLALGRPYLIAAMALANLAVLAPMMIWLVGLYGPLGAAWAVVSGAVPMIVLMFVFNRRFLGTRFHQTVLLTLRPVAGAALMAASVLALKSALPETEAPFALAAQLALLAGVGGAVYVSAVLLLARFSAAEPTPESLVARLVMSRFRRGRKP